MRKIHTQVFVLLAAALLISSCEIDSGGHKGRSGEEIRSISNYTLSATHSAPLYAFYHAMRLNAFMELDPTAKADSKYSDISYYPATGLFKSDAGYSFETGDIPLTTPGALWTVKMDQTQFTITCDGLGAWTVSCSAQYNRGGIYGPVNSRLQFFSREGALDGSLVFSGTPWGLYSENGNSYFIRLTGSKELYYKFRKDLPYFNPNNENVKWITIKGDILVEICNSTGTLDWCRYTYYDTGDPVILSSI